jgi:hypothetical protein
MRAKDSAAAGWPEMGVLVDGAEVAKVPVTVTTVAGNGTLTSFRA